MPRTLSALDDLSPDLDRATLLRRVTRVLEFARLNIANLDRHAPFWPATGSAIVTQADKVVVETALLSLLASRIAATDAALAREFNGLIGEIAPLARSESNKVRLLRFPQTAASLGIAHVCLSAIGNRDEEFDALIRAAFSSGLVDAIERLPYRAMDLAWLRSIHEQSPHRPSRGLLAQSILTSCAHPAYMAEMDVYALTHALMYLTDFGARALPEDIDAEHASEMVDACLGWELLTANMDLLGEVLIGAVLVAGPWSPSTRLAFQMLTAVWDEFGFLPSAAFEVDRYRALSGDEASAYAFHHVYHTTYVAGILCMLLLRCPERRTGSSSWTCSARVDRSLVTLCRSTVHAAHRFCSSGRLACEKRSAANVETADRDVRGRRCAESVLDGTIAQLDTYPSPVSRPGAPWRRAIEGHAAITRAELALVLNDAVLVQAIRDYNLATLAAALLERAGSALPLSRTLLEATAFLCRQQLPSGAIGAHFVIPQNCSSIHASEVTATLADCVERLLFYIRSQSADPSRPARALAVERQHGLRRADQHAVRLDKSAGNRHQPSQGRLEARRSAV